MNIVMGMTETTMLLWSVVLGLVQIVIASIAVNKDVGLPYNLSSRDEPLPPLSKTAGRLVRAAANFRETFGLFAVSVILVVLLHRQGSNSAIGAQLYFWARLVYVPIYALGIQMVRTLVWAVSIVGVVMVMLAAFGIA
ncbi:MAG: MAPEG family protein [Rhizomicrobium sp.]